MDSTMLQVSEGVSRIYLRHAPDKNLALELEGFDERPVTRLVFRFTNPARSESYDAERRARIEARFLTPAGAV